MKSGFGAWLCGIPRFVCGRLGTARVPALICIASILSSPLTVLADGLEPFPRAGPGQERFVIRLPAVANEDERKVEIMAGREMPVDCNRHWFGGDLKQSVVKGWGYTYYEIPSVGPAASTMMACPGQEKTTAFVQVRGDGFLIRYNSKLPVVVYVPEGFAVRYRIWAASPQTMSARPE